jgi:histidinol-phosphate aminotransferase
MSLYSSPDYQKLAVKGVQALHPYQPGKPTSELARELGLSHIVKLASNENPLGFSPKVKKALENEYQEGTRYPDASGHYLKSLLAERLNIQTTQITLGNGSNDVLEIIARCFLTSNDEVIFSEHAFCVYSLISQAIGARLVEIPAKNWGNDLDGILKAITSQTKIIFIANPNNPTGTWLTETELKGFMLKVPSHILVVIDEAYTEYVTDGSIPQTIDWLNQFDHLIVTKTFSKAYGLASLRIGYAVANEGITSLLNRLRQPFNVNSFALSAAIAVLNDFDYLKQSIEVNSEGKEQLIIACMNQGLSYIPSAGNFLSIDMGRNAALIYEKLLHQGVIVRPIANYKMPHHLRVSIGLKTENQRYIDAIQSII